MKKILIVCLVLTYFSNLLCDDYKLVGLVPVRNEEKMIIPCLKALSMFTDAIIVLDDASDDNTVGAIESVAKACNVKKIITKKVWYRDEPGDKNKLLQAGREIGGTHFVVVDADEMFTANLLKNNFLKKEIFKLQPGEVLNVTWINLWRSCDFYRYDYSVWSGQDVNVAFCDDGKCFYKSDFIHTSRTPANLSGKRIMLPVDKKDFSYLDKQLKDHGFSLEKNNRFGSGVSINKQQFNRYLKDQVFNRGMRVDYALGQSTRFFWRESGQSTKGCYLHDFTAGLMHFQFVNWDNLLAKQAWYRCLEKIRNPNVDTTRINNMYGESKDERDLRVTACPLEWFEGYSFFDKETYEKNESWQKKQIKKWFGEYGREFFADLDIWDIKWN